MKCYQCKKRVVEFCVPIGNVTVMVCGKCWRIVHKKSPKIADKAKMVLGGKLWKFGKRPTDGH
jgi:hypothetical protein